MFEDDRAPVTLSEIYSQSASCQRTRRQAQPLLRSVYSVRCHISLLCNQRGARVRGGSPSGRAQSVVECLIDRRNPGDNPDV